MKNSNNNSQNAKNVKSTSSQNKATNATNEHKHPNQYTKGADDKSAKNSVGGKNCR